MLTFDTSLEMHAQTIVKRKTKTSFVHMRLRLDVPVIFRFFSSHLAKKWESYATFRTGDQTLKSSGKKLQAVYPPVFVPLGIHLIGL